MCMEGWQPLSFYHCSSSWQASWPFSTACCVQSPYILLFSDSAQDMQTMRLTEGINNVRRFFFTKLEEKWKQAQRNSADSQETYTWPWSCRVAVGIVPRLPVLSGGWSHVQFLGNWIDVGMAKEKRKRESSLVKTNSGYLKHMIGFHFLAETTQWKCVMWWQKEGNCHLLVSNTANNIFLSRHQNCFCAIYAWAAGNRSRATSCFSALTHG